MQAANESAALPPDTMAARLDRLPVTRLHWTLITVCAFGLMFDVAEAALGNALATVFSGPPHQISSLQLSLLLASVFAGGAIGAPLMGWQADRRGRLLALTFCLLLLAATSLLAALSRDVGTLTLFRLLSGVALGAYPPLMVAYLSDVLPPGRRGMLILLVGAIGFLGAPGVIFLVRWLTPLEPLGIEGWRWALIIGALGAGVTGVIFSRLPESPRWLVAAGRGSEAEAVCARFERSARGFSPVAPASRASSAEAGETATKLPAGAMYRGPALILCALYFLSPWATIGFPLLSGAVLVQKGFAVGQSLLFVGLALLGPSLGVLAGATFIDRIERRTTLVLCALGMAGFGLLFAVSVQPPALVATGIAFNLVGSIYVGALSIYAAELFPTKLRATVSSSAWAVNRVASAIVPLTLLPLLNTAGALPMFWVIAGAMVASAILLVVGAQPGLSRRPVT